MTDLWTNLDRIIGAAPGAGALRMHGLGPIAAWRMREESVPADVDRVAHGARLLARPASRRLTG